MSMSIVPAHHDAPALPAGNDARDSASRHQSRPIPGWILGLIMVGLVTLVFAVYWPTMWFGYVAYDDPWHVENNPAVRNGLSIVTVQWAFRFDSSVDYWHPLSWISLML